MKCLYNLRFENIFSLISRACFVCLMESLSKQASKRLLTTHPFNYINVSLKMSTN